ncbi:hypothetical protein CYY_000114 [Polysphondylium violaceum]|uniref:Cytochrome P450 family protein n=1 Tax=Polysphondylium violaceum TaxID=133409 RepID=A0A8J4VBW8_9MYCE|nr:hypothetical protein CYY_000114 [Polysphondylium violaceum]
MLISIVLYLLLGYIVWSFLEKNVIGIRNKVKGPLSLPIIGNLHQFASPHFTFDQMANQYGSVFRVWMGDFYALIINDIDLYKGIYVKNNKLFINRPLSPGFQRISGDFKNIIHSPNPVWGENKDLVKHNFTNKALVGPTKPIFEKHMKILVDKMDEAYDQSKLFDTKYYIERCHMNMVLDFFTSSHVGYEHDSDEWVAKFNDSLIGVVEDARYGDILSSVGFLSPLYKRKLAGKRPSNQNIIDYLDVELKKHKETYNPELKRDIMDALITSFDESKHDRINYIIHDFFLAGVESQVCCCEWFFIYLSTRPEIQNKAYEELKSVFGDSKVVDYSMKNKTPYVNSIIKELLRIKTPLPLSIPRIAEEDVTINGIFIPAHTLIIPNMYHIHRNEKYWSKPTEFDPERFMVENETSLPYIPYGLGERGCIGLNIANSCLYHVIATVLLNYSFSSKTLLSLEEQSDLVIHPKNRSINVILKKR